MRKVFDILAYGDSLTWGANPGMNRRLPYDARWPSVAQAVLGDRARIINAGLSGRTSQFDDFSKGYDRNGLSTLPLLLAMHKPLDLIVLMFGANDLKPTLCGNADGTVSGIARMVEVIRTTDFSTGEQSDILIVSPPHLRTRSNGEPPTGGRSIIQSRRLGPMLLNLAAETGCAFLDSATQCDTSSIDGVHIDAANAVRLGKGIGTAILDILGPEVPSKA